MNLEEQISEVEKQLDLILSGSDDGWLDLGNYSLLSKSARRKDSRYGLITDILKYGEEGQRIIDHNTNKKLYITFMINVWIILIDTQLEISLEVSQIDK